MKQQEMNPSAPSTYDRSRYVSTAIAAMLSALLMLGMSACSKTQEHDALSASQTRSDYSELTEDTASSSPAPADDVTEDADDGTATSTEQSAAAGYVTRTPKAANISPEAQRVAAQKLDGHWLLDADATLELLPEESREGLREVFGQVRTGVTFTQDGDATMNVVAQGEKNEQAGKYAVADAKEEAVRIEFLIDDPELEAKDVRIFATLVFEDEDTVRYQASTEEQGRVVQREQIAVMKRVSSEKYHDVLK